MLYLHWNNWNRSSGGRYHMDRNSFNGKPYTHYFYAAMRMAFADEEGRLGIVSTGQLFATAKADADANGYVGFGPSELQTYLGDGKFKFAPVGSLEVQGPRLRIPRDHTTFALAELGGHIIELNFYFLMARVDTIIGQNANGETALIWATAAVMLHEILHNHGFDHPEDVNHATGATYRQTFPVVAAHAMMALSPVSLRNIGLGLTGAPGTVFENYPM